MRAISLLSAALSASTTVTGRAINTDGPASGVPGGAPRSVPGGSSDGHAPTTGFSTSAAHDSSNGSATCLSGPITVYASTTQNVHYNYNIPQTQVEVTQLFVNFMTPNNTYIPSITGGAASAGGTYKIYSTICYPKGKDQSSVKGVQVLSHGAWVDGSYWDFAPGYSYVDAAAAAGWATFSYDRLGVGKSADPKLDPVNEVQSPLQLEILRFITTNLRNGVYTGGNGFNKVIGVGHSFGSFLTQGMTVQYPEVFDAAVLTGFSTSMEGFAAFFNGLNLVFANTNSPTRFSTLSNGYLVSDTNISNHIGFFSSPGFSTDILNLAEERKASVTFGELFTTGALTKPAPSFAGPVAIVIGDEDLPFCAGNCTRLAAPGGNAMDFVKAALYESVPDSKFGQHIAPQAGHGLNFHYSANAAFEWVQKGLVEQGLTPV